MTKKPLSRPALLALAFVFVFFFIAYRSRNTSSTITTDTPTTQIKQNEYKLDGDTFSKIERDALGNELASSYKLIIPNGWEVKYNQDQPYMEEFLKGDYKVTVVSFTEGGECKFQGRDVTNDVNWIYSDYGWVQTQFGKYRVSQAKETKVRNRTFFELCQEVTEGTGEKHFIPFTNIGFVTIEAPLNYEKGSVKESFDLISRIEVPKN